VFDCNKPILSIAPYTKIAVRRSLGMALRVRTYKPT
jgi:hypothetical protein